MPDLSPFWLIPVAVLATLVVAGGMWLRKQVAMLRFIGEATAQLEGTLPAMQESARRFEAEWAAVWAEPEWAAAAAHYGGPPCPALSSFYGDPAHGRIEDVRLFGPGAPPEGLPVRNYMPLSMKWTVTMAAGADRSPTDHVVAHPGELDASVYVVDWLAGGPVFHVGRDDVRRVQVADSLEQLLRWAHRPAPGNAAQA